MQRLRKWMRRMFLILVQVALMEGLNIVGTMLVKAAGWPIPGSMIGCAVLFVALQSKLLPLSWIEQGANWLLANMLLFFVPSAVGIMQYGHLLKSEGLPLLVTIVMGILLVMSGTGLVADWLVHRGKGGAVHVDVRTDSDHRGVSGFKERVS